MEEEKPQLRYRNVCFTLNNYTINDELRIKNLWKNDKCKYIVFGREVGDNGTPHLQGYIEFKNQKTFNCIKKLLGDRCHIEGRKGTSKQASKYCKKDGDVFEKGNLSKPGKRTDMETIRDWCKKDKPMIDIAENYPGQFIRYNKGIEKLKKLYHNVERTEKPIVTWIYGKSGTGKTRYVYDLHTDIYVKDETKWWDGYDNNEVILIDDFEGIWPFRNLLRLLDRYKYQGEYKGGYVHINSKYIYITSEFPPKHYYHDEDNDNHYQQLFRRIDTIVNL